MFLMTFVLMGMAGVAIWQGKNLVNSAIAQSPDVTAVHADLREVRAELGTVKDGAATAKVAADEAKKAADDTAVKVDDSQKRIFSALEDQRKSDAATRDTLATLTERIAGVAKQLDRVEEKQDR